jgi:hypothetical protein
VLCGSSLKSIVELHLGFHEALRLVRELNPRLLIKKYWKFRNAVTPRKRREKKLFLPISRIQCWGSGSGFFGTLLDSDPGPLVRGTDPDPDPDLSIIKQKW